VGPHATSIIRILQKEYPRAKIALDFKTPLELFVATVLSAQCTDKRVNLVTPTVFNKYRTAADYTRADKRTFEQEIRSTGFFRNKTKNILAAAKLMVEKYQGRVPDTMEEMLTLPGVARKTATVILFNAFHKIEGITVDTHVIRLSQRLGLSKNTNPVKIEQDLMKLVPRPLWGKFSYWIIEHGRKVCQAKKPDCEPCVLNKVCPSAFKIKNVKSPL